MLNYVLTSQPATEPVPLATAKSHLRVDFTNDDALIQAYITAARQHCEQKMQRAIFNQGYTLFLDQFNYGDWRSTIPMDRRNPLRFSSLWESMALRLPMPRLVSVQSITYLDTTGTQQTLPAASYTVDPSSEPGRIVPTQSGTWPTTDYYIPGSVQVNFTAGSYGDGVVSNNCPQPIALAILLLTGHFYRNREATDGGQAMTAIPLGVDALLSPYRFMGM